MSETLIPTMSLRFVRRPQSYEGTSMVRTIHTMKVLQQMFRHQEGGPDVWIDVPLRDESIESFSRNVRISEGVK